MALKYVTDIDLNNNELQNAVVQNLATTPSGLEAGRIWFNTADSYLYYYNGTASIPIGAVNFETSASNIKMDGTASVGTLSTGARADHIHPSDTKKADKTATVSNVAFDSTNSKITKTINGTTTDVVGTATEENAGLLSADDKKKLIDTYTAVGTVPTSPVNNWTPTNITGGDEAQGMFLIMPGNNINVSRKQDTGTGLYAYRFDATNTTYSSGTEALLSAGTDTANRSWSAKILHDYIESGVPTTTWLTPTVTNNAITITNGGYYTSGRHCYVQMRFTLTAALSANSGIWIASGMPNPTGAVGVLNIIVNSRGGHGCRVNTDGRIQLIADVDHGITTETAIDVTGVYTIS